VVLLLELLELELLDVVLRLELVLFVVLVLDPLLVLVLPLVVLEPPVVLDAAQHPYTFAPLTIMKQGMSVPVQVNPLTEVALVVLPPDDDPLPLV
jgi:hypothetical protein